MGSDPDNQRSLTFFPAHVVQHAVPRDGEHPGSGVLVFGWKVIQAAPSNEEGFVDDILGVLGTSPALHEAEYVGVHQLV
ncbi:hypothetical protein RCJ92_08590 [Glutamicibacter sp. BSL13]